jgi:transposase
MMGYDPPPNDPLFSFYVQLETRVRKDHPLRKIKELIDFDFIYDEVRKTYGEKGNVSVPPPVILKLMLLLILYNVRSERELMETLPERLDWLWFLGFTIESPIPDHSVLSKARKRWGEDGPFHDLAKDIADLHQRLSFLLRKTSAGSRPYGSGLSIGVRGL